MDSSLLSAISMPFRFRERLYSVFRGAKEDRDVKDKGLNVVRQRLTSVSLRVNTPFLLA